MARRTTDEVGADPTPAVGARPAAGATHERRTRVGARAHGRVPVALAAAAVTALAFPTLLLLDAHGLVSGDPRALTALVLANALLLSDRVQLTLVGGSGLDRPVPRLVLAFAASAAMLWLSGWAFLLPATAVLVSIGHVRRTNGRVWPRMGLVVTACTVVGQVATQLQLVPSAAVAPEVSHVAASWLLVLAWLTLADVGLSVIEEDAVTDALARTDARLRALMDSATDVLTVTDRDGVLTYVSPASERTTGHSADALVGTYLLDLVRPEHRTQAAGRIAEVMAAPGARLTLDVPIAHADGESRWHEWNVHNLLEDPLVQGLVVDQRDVTDRRYQEELLTHAASHDDLTGLPNRRELLRLLALGLRSVGPGAGLAVLFVDLDRFKAVNDTYGHSAGDEVLVEVGRRLREHLRHGDVLARLGGDEFGAVLVEVREDSEITELVRRLEATVTAPVQLAAGTVRVGVSIGVATTHDPLAEPSTLFTAADTAMYRVKNAHRERRGRTDGSA
jgi:diguanylate cyclase (GGDEF)-like protein/PAS domain S-box-containing protein